MVRQVIGLNGQPYEERLEELSLEKMESRRTRLHIIQTFKIIRGTDNVNVDHWLSLLPENHANQTRRKARRLALKRPNAKLEIRKNFFSNRIVTMSKGLILKTRQQETVAKFKNMICGERF